MQAMTKTFVKPVGVRNRSRATAPGVKKTVDQKSGRRVEKRTLTSQNLLRTVANCAISLPVIVRSIFRPKTSRALLEKVVKAGECGAVVTGDEVSTAAGMAAFVEKIFLGPPPPPPPAAAAPVVVPPVVPAPAVPDKLEAVYFDFDKYTIKDEGREALKRNADWLQKNADRKVVVEGNCDERGTNEYNMALGQRRADAAAKYLTDLGIAKDRVSSVSYGEEKPICKEATEDCWGKNRRDDIVVVKH